MVFNRFNYGERYKIISIYDDINLINHCKLYFSYLCSEQADLSLPDLRERKVRTAKGAALSKGKVSVRVQSAEKKITVRLLADKGEKVR